MANASRGHCPACHAPIPLWEVVKAPLPSRLRCGGCRARLGFDVNLFAITGMAALILAAVVWLARPLYGLLAGLGILLAAGSAAAAALGLWLLFELALAWFLLRRRQVVLTDE